MSDLSLLMTVVSQHYKHYHIRARAHYLVTHTHLYVHSQVLCDSMYHGYEAAPFFNQVKKQISIFLYNHLNQYLNFS